MQAGIQITIIILYTFGKRVVNVRCTLVIFLWANIANARLPMPINMKGAVS